MPGATLKDLNALDKAKVATLVEKVGLTIFDVSFNTGDACS
jgi:hypothetical protein